MSGTVTPARRRWEEDDDECDPESFHSSDACEGSSRSSAAKRARLDIADGSDGGVSESGDGDLLPDSFRRSPKTRGNGGNMVADGHEPQEHQPGSIVRVTLTDFVTYTKAEFHPGPNLNMVIGPNGTGKSTLVCAICLGLGWSTSHLGRAKDLGEFVKHGAKKAEIEIELARDPERHDENPVITTRITRDGNKSEYLIDRKKSNKKGVQQLARSFSIQVDNLCQFLPQDRVVEFAALSPEDLLVQTQRAAAPEYMTEWHDELKTLRKEQRAQQEEQQRLIESLKQDENRQRLQHADVERLRQRSEYLERKAALEKLRPFPLYAVVKRQHSEVKRRMKEVEREVARIRQAQGPYREAEEAKIHYLERIEKAVGVRDRHVKRHENLVAADLQKIEEVSERIEGLVRQLDAEDKSTRSVKQNITNLQREITAITNAMNDPPEAFDAAAMNDESRTCVRRMRDIEGRLLEIKRELDESNKEGFRRRDIIEQAMKDKNDLQSQAGRQANKLKTASKDAAIAWQWIQNNRDKFESEVYGPPIVECSVKDPRYASAVETVIQEGEKTAFTVTSSADFKMLNQQLAGVMKLNRINIRNSPYELSSYPPPMPKEELRQYGFQSYVLDLIDGPDAVLAMLCDNSRIHQAAYTSGDISNAQYERLEESVFTTCITSKSVINFTRRREYGRAGTQGRVNDLRQPRWLTDSPVDHQQERELDAKINEAKSEIDEIMQHKNALKAESDSHKREYNEAKNRRDAIEKEKNDKQRSLAAFNGLPARKQRAEEKLAGIMEQINGSKDRKRKIGEEIDTQTVDKGQLVLKYAHSVDVLRGMHDLLFEAQIMEIEARSELEQLRAHHAEEENRLNEREKELQQLGAEVAQALDRGRRLQAQCTQIGANFTDVEQAVYEEQSEPEQWSPERMEEEIESVTARIEMNAGGGNESTLREYEARAERIEGKKARLTELENKLKDLFTRIEELRGQWEPQLDELITQISDAFAENFSRIQCAGEVAVYKDDDFSQWAIQIKVKFRENEQLSLLDSHRQSGGERAVSTIFYLMALQSLARAPFRVVDEINQGMDPRNERLVHSRMVDIACAGHTSQYFLITPKLLSGLKYHRNMKVHCIASGEYMPEDHRELDFEALARTALAVRRGGGDAQVAG